MMNDVLIGSTLPGDKVTSASNLTAQIVSVTPSDINQRGYFFHVGQRARVAEPPDR
jgi:hypothetical protein